MWRPYLSGASSSCQQAGGRELQVTWSQPGPSISASLRLSATPHRGHLTHACRGAMVSNSSPHIKLKHKNPASTVQGSCMHVQVHGWFKATRRPPAIQHPIAGVDVQGQPMHLRKSRASPHPAPTHVSLCSGAGVVQSGNSLCSSVDCLSA
eukprot:jgi/Mesen1/10217/ME000770S09642